MCLFLKGGQVYPVPPSLYSQRPCFVVSPLCIWWLVVVGGCMQGIGVSGGWVGCVSPGVLTWIGLALCHPPTVAATHWSSAPAPGILVCSCGWRAPKWSQSYSWCIRTYLSRISSTWWPGDWLTFSGLSSPPSPAVHPPRRKRGRSAGAAVGMPPGTSASSPFQEKLVEIICLQLCS